MKSEKNVITMRECDGNVVKFESVGAVTSTSAIAKEYAKKGYPDRYVVFSDRRITSDDGDGEYGIYMSLLLRPSIFPSQASLLGAMSATAMATGFEEHTSKRLGVGWVSDLYCEGVRIGAATVEGKLDNFTTYEYIIVTFEATIGEEHFPPRLTDMVRKVFESDNTSIPMIIAKTVLNKFFGFYQNLKTPSKFMDIYNKKFILRGVRVRYTTEQKRHYCKVLGVDTKTGALILEGRNGDVIRATSPACVQMPKRIKLKR